MTGVKYDEHKSTIVTKQAVISNSTTAQKSSIPAEEQNSNIAKSRQESLVTISNQSPMEQLLQTEAKMIHNKATAEAKAPDGQLRGEKKSKEEAISDNIQTLSEHLKKVDEKSDMTALEENDTKTIHPKVSVYNDNGMNGKGQVWSKQGTSLEPARGKVRASKGPGPSLEPAPR